VASPQVENGYIRIANEVLQAMMRTNLSPYESRVLYCIWRKTYGFNKKTDQIALSQFASELDLDRRLVHRALKSLSSKKMIVVIRTDDKRRIRYGFQKDYSKWKPPVVISTDDSGVISTDDKVSSLPMTEVSSVPIPTKDTITKDTIKDKRSDLSGKQNSIPFKEIISYLNEKADREFKHSTPKTKDLIRARWNEGFRYEDFIQVIDNKTTDWLTHPKYSKYLRPETLFGTKFEGYRNEKRHRLTGAISEKAARTMENFKDFIQEGQ